MKVTIVRNAVQAETCHRRTGMTANLLKLNPGDALILNWNRLNQPNLKSNIRTLAKRQGLSITVRMVGTHKLQVFRIA